MDALRAVEIELENLFSKLETFNTRFEANVTHLIAFVSTIKAKIDKKVEENENYELTEEEVNRLSSMINEVKTTLNQTSTNHRSAHTDVCKLGKAIDRNFDDDFEEATKDLFPDAADNSVRSEKLNQVICEHLFREGMHDVAELLRQEAGVEVGKTSVKPLAQQKQILDALKQKDLGPAIDWVMGNREALANIGSTLEFELHKLAFLVLVEAGKEYQKEAVEYARENLAPLVEQHEYEVKSLMGSLMYSGNIHRSPYAKLFNGQLWDDVCEMFQKESCNILDIPTLSPLPVCIVTGCAAIRTRSNIRQVIKARQSEHYWNGANALPIETRLGEEFQFHSVFACPILRQQSSDENPPVRLTCGHVISNEALCKLIITNRKNQKKEIIGKKDQIKCPYCPVQGKAAMARQIKF